MVLSCYPMSLAYLDHASRELGQLVETSGDPNELRRDSRPDDDTEVGGHQVHAALDVLQDLERHGIRCLPDIG